MVVMRKHPVWKAGGGKRVCLALMKSRVPFPALHEPMVKAHVIVTPGSRVQEAQKSKAILGCKESLNQPGLHEALF